MQLATEHYTILTLATLALHNTYSVGGEVATLHLHLHNTTLHLHLKVSEERLQATLALLTILIARASHSHLGLRSLFRLNITTVTEGAPWRGHRLKHPVAKMQHPGVSKARSVIEAPVGQLAQFPPNFGTPPPPPLRDLAEEIRIWPR